MPILLQNERSCYNSSFYYRFLHRNSCFWFHLPCNIRDILILYDLPSITDLQANLPLKIS
jgi:hypothetical protein